LPERTTLVAVPVLKGFDARGEMRRMFSYGGFPSEIIDDLMEQLTILSDHHFGGYAKFNDELLDRMQQIFNESNIPLDPIYTGKSFVAMLDFIETNDLRDAKILFVHTGGISGGKAIEIESGRKFS
jgi:1-aminocyclopropane-1-carboxylate deaminase